MFVKRHALIVPIILTTVLLLAAGARVFAIIFALITLGFYLDYLRRGDSAEYFRDNHPPRNNLGLEERKEDYLLLGLQPGAPVSEVRRVYKHLAAQFHPDTGIYLSESQRKSSQEAFIRIRDAHDRIIESSKISSMSGGPFDSGPEV